MLFVLFALSTMSSPLLVLEVNKVDGCAFLLKSRARWDWFIRKMRLFSCLSYKLYYYSYLVILWNCSDCLVTFTTRRTSIFVLLIVNYPTTLTTVWKYLLLIFSQKCLGPVLDFCFCHSKRQLSPTFKKQLSDSLGDSCKTKKTNWYLNSKKFLWCTILWLVKSWELWLK